MAFPKSEYRNRLESVQSEMREQDIDVMVITRPQNYYYLTGFRSLGQGLAPLLCAVVPRNGDPRMLNRSLEGRCMETYTWASGNRLYDDDEDPFDYLSEMIRDASAESGTIGIEKRSKFMSVQTYNELQDAFPDATFRDVSGLVDGHRQVKSDRELEYMHAAGDIADAGLRAAVEAVAPGTTPGNIIAAAHDVMYGMGQDDMSADCCLVWGGSQGGMMHDTRIDNELTEGDVVTMEVFGIQELYAANVMSTVYIGDEPPADLQERYDVTWELHDAGCGALAPGNRAEEAHIAVDKANREAGFGEYYRRVGGCIGIHFSPTFFFEGTSLVKGESQPFEPGMTILVQPGPLEPEMIVTGSTSVITENGSESLTHPLESFTI